MAANWIKWVKGLAKKPEVLAMSAILGRDRFEVAGRLMQVWEWADDVSSDGSLVTEMSRNTSRNCHAQNATLVLIDTESGIQNFAKAMQEVGWLDVSEDGQITIPKFDRHNGKSAKTRGLAADRKRLERKRKTATKPSRKKRDTSSLVYSSLLSSEKYCLADCLKCDEFATAWDLWVRHRKDIKKPLTPTSVSQQLAEFGEWGCKRSVVAIRYTIKKGWQGIREPDETPLFGNGKPDGTKTRYEDPEGTYRG